VDVAVNHLTDTATLVAALQALSQRHTSYGAKVPHYGVVGRVLLFTLEACAGPDVWTAEVAKSWLLAYRQARLDGATCSRHQS